MWQCNKVIQISPWSYLRDKNFIANANRIKMYLHRINVFDSYNRSASLFRTSNALCFIQDMYLRKKSHCQVEWNISRGIYTNSEFSSTSHCCLGYLRLHEEGKAWRNCGPRKMIRCGSGTRTSINILISLFPMYHQLKQWPFRMRAANFEICDIL